MDVREKTSNEKRLIDANELKKRMCFKCNDEYSDEPCEPGDCVFCNAINDAQTIYAVEVLRCRDCKYWGDEDGKLQDSDGALCARCKVHNYLIDGRHTGWCPTENDFCSYGKRKEGAD